VTAGGKCNLQLRTHAIHTADQHRVPHLRQRETRPETTDVGQHTARECSTRHFADLRYCTVGLINIDARFPVRYLFQVVTITVGNVPV